MKDNSEENRCKSRVKWCGDVYPCHRQSGHKGKHRYCQSWTDKEARLSGGVDSKGKGND